MDTTTMTLDQLSAAFAQMEQQATEYVTKVAGDRDEWTRQVLASAFKCGVMAGWKTSASTLTLDIGHLAI